MGRKRLIVAADLLAEIFRAGSRHRFRVICGLPSDARVVGVQFDGEHVELEIESRVFEPAPKGVPMPAIEIVCENLSSRALESLGR